MRKLRPQLIIIFLGIIIFSWTIFFDFSYFDDQSLILENYQLISDPSNIGLVFVEDAFFSDNNFYYRPLLNLSLMFDAQISSNYAWFFHLANVFWHILAVILLFLVLKILGVSEKRALGFSLFFLLQPALVSATAWVPGRNDTLLAVFILSSFLFFLKFIDYPKVLNYFLCLIFFLLALFTKEAAIILPILFIFYYFLISSKKIKRADTFLFTGGVGAVIFLWFIFRSLAIDGYLGSWQELILSILENSPAIIIGLGKFLFPFNLATMSLLREVNIIYGLVAILLIALLAVYRKIDKKWLSFGLTWFILFMLPSFVNPNPSEFYYLLLLEHRLYLPFLGLIFIFKDISIDEVSFIKRMQLEKAISYLFIVVLLLFAVISINRLPSFSNRLSFWLNAVEQTPNSPLAQRNLGVMLYFDNNLTEAEIAYKRSIELNPLEKMVHNNLGVIYLNRGELELAEVEFKKELEINPGYDKALDNLNNLNFLKNKLR